MASPLRLVEASRYRTPFHSASFTARGSFATSDVVSKCIVGLRAGSYFGQPQSPVVANATQAACIAVASGCLHVQLQSADGRFWPIATDDALTTNRRFRGIADMDRFSSRNDL